MTKKDKRTICLLGLLSIALVFILTSDVFGNTIDWYSQHVVIADALRHAIRSEGTLFPTYIVKPQTLPIIITNKTAN